MADQLPRSGSGPVDPLGTAEPWDLVAPAYAAEALPVFEAYAREALRVAALPASARVADVACGPGTISLLAAAAGARVSALDVSPRMVEAARTRAQAAGLADRVDVQLGDGQRLPLEGGAYDAAFSMFGLMFFPDRLAGLREMRRVLRPGGRAIISSWVPFDGPFRALMQTTTEMIPGLRLGGGAPPLSSPEQIREEMTAAGFPQVTVEVVGHSITAPSFDTFWDQVERTNAPLVLLAHRLGSARWTEMAPKIRERVRQALGDGPLVVSRGAYLGVGTV